MELTVIIPDQRYKIAAVTKNGTCEATDFLEKLNKTYQSSVDGLYVVLELVSREGLQDISTKLSHLVHSKEKIYEFIKGDLRLFYFKGEGDMLVICTTAIIKKTQQVDENQVAKAIAFKKKYLQSIKDDTLVLIEGN